MKLALFSLFFSAVLAQSTNSTKRPGIPNPPTNYGVVVYPEFTELDVFGPLQWMNSISSMKAINLSIIASSLLPVSTRITNKTQLKVASNFAQAILPTHTFEQAPEDLEVLLVPGGADNFQAPPEGLDAIAYIKETYPRLRYLISTCTGATLLARAGVLDGRRATTNKRAWGFAVLQGPHVEWVPTARWVVDGNIWTTSGVAAGMGGMLGFIEEIYGTDFAWTIANNNEYNWNSDPSWDPYSKLFNVTSS